MDDEGQDNWSQITTGSRLRMWWLRLFRGYSVESRRRMPKQNLFGEIYYKSHWVLCKREED